MLVFFGRGYSYKSVKDCRLVNYNNYDAQFTEDWIDHVKFFRVKPLALNIILVDKHAIKFIPSFHSKLTESNITFLSKSKSRL